VNGKSDMYGIGIRIAAYLQVVMTIIGDAYTADPKYATALTSLNLWFLWALIIAIYLCNDSYEWRDAYMLRELGNTIYNTNVGVLLLPREKLDPESVFTRLMRWVTVFVWLSASLPQATASYAHYDNNPECDYGWYFDIYQFHAEKHRRISVDYSIVSPIIGTFSLVLTLRILIYAVEFPWSEIDAALNSSKDTLGANKHSWSEVCRDILFIYPVGDIMALVDTVSNHGFRSVILCAPGPALQAPD